MKSFRTNTNITNRVIPARGQVVYRPESQSGPFALLPNTQQTLFLGAGSVIKIGHSANTTSFYTEYDLSGSTINISTNTFVVCNIYFNNGIPQRYEFVNLSTSSNFYETKYKDGSKWPSPKNVEYLSFVIATIFPYNPDLKTSYGNSVCFGPNDSWAAIRHTYTALQIVQTCYGFNLIASPYW